MTTIIFNPTQSYLPTYNPLMVVMSSTNSSRGSFLYLTDVYVDNNLVGTLTSNDEPGETFSSVNVARIASSEISYDLNFNIAGATSTPNSIKSLRVEVGESYNNVITFTGITESSIFPFNGYTTFLTNDGQNIVSGGRIEVELDDSTTGPFLNGYWSVIDVGSNYITIDDAQWNYPGYTQSGRIKEGVEFYDASFNFNNGTVIIETSTNHRFNDGDSFLLNLDSYAYATVEFLSTTSSAGISNLETNVNGITYSLIASPVSGIDVNDIALQLALEINSNNPLKFTAFNNQFDNPNVVYIYSNRIDGGLTVGANLFFGTFGSIGFTYSLFSKNPKAGPKGGWNSFSGIWKVKNVLSPTKFRTEIPWQNNTITGSQRGSIISLDNYEFKNRDSFTGSFIMNNYFQYENLFDYPLPPLALTEDPRDCIPFSSWDDYQSIDLMTLIGPTLSAPNSFTMRVTYPLGGSFSDYNYSLSTLKGYKEPRVSFGVGPKNISDINGTFSALKPDDYNVLILDQFGNTFYNKNFCYKCRTKDYYRVMWLNKYGAWDFYDFNFADRSVEGEKDSFYRAIGSYNGTKWSKKNGERGLTPYDNRTFHKFLFYTDLLKRNEGEWLVTFFNSNEHYLSVGGELTPLIITSPELIRFNESDKVRQIQFEGRFAFNNISGMN